MLFIQAETVAVLPPTETQLDLYELIDDKVNADTIRDLLRTLKPEHKDEIMLTAPKPQLLETLKRLVVSGTLDVIRVFDLLREGEENGRQRLFFFHPNTETSVDLGDPAKVGHLLFGPKWKSRFEIPLLTRKPNGAEIVDFRPHDKKPLDWLLKLYAYDTKRKFLGRTPVDRRGHFTESWQQIEKRAVLLARWNSRRGKGWLELRVSQGIDGSLSRHLENLWEVLKPAVKQLECRPVDLGPAMNRLFREQSQNTTTYRLFDAQASDLQHCGYTIHPYDGENETLSTTKHGNEFVSRIVDGGGTCDVLVVEWLPGGSGNVLQKPLRTVIGGGTRLTAHQLTISAEAPAVAIDYVTDQLRRFGA